MLSTFNISEKRQQFHSGVHIILLEHSHENSNLGTSTGRTVRSTKSCMVYYLVGVKHKRSEEHLPTRGRWITARFGRFLRLRTIYHKLHHEQLGFSGTVTATNSHGPYPGSRTRDIEHSQSVPSQKEANTTAGSGIKAIQEPASECDWSAQPDLSTNPDRKQTLLVQGINDQQTQVYLRTHASREAPSCPLLSKELQASGSTSELETVLSAQYYVHPHLQPGPFAANICWTVLGSL